MNDATKEMLLEMGQLMWTLLCAVSVMFLLSEVTGLSAEDIDSFPGRIADALSLIFLG